MQLKALCNANKLIIEFIMLFIRHMKDQGVKYQPNDWVWKLCLFSDNHIASSADGNTYIYDESGKLNCPYHNLKDVSSFLLTSSLDPLIPGGSFITNNPELIQVTRIESNLPAIGSSDEKNNYYLINKSVEKIINSIHHKKESNLLRFIFLPLQLLDEGSYLTY